MYCSVDLGGGGGMSQCPRCLTSYACVCLCERRATLQSPQEIPPAAEDQAAPAAAAEPPSVAEDPPPAAPQVTPQPEMPPETGSTAPETAGAEGGGETQATEAADAVEDDALRSSANAATDAPGEPQAPEPAALTARSTSSARSATQKPGFEEQAMLAVIEGKGSGWEDDPMASTDLTDLDAAAKELMADLQQASQPPGETPQGEGQEAERRGVCCCRTFPLCGCRHG